MYTQYSDTNKNNITATEEYRFKKTTLISHPPQLTIETTSVCNLKCIMCPHSINEVDRPRHMPDEIIDKITTFIDNSKKIQLHGIGEPTISPSFWKILPIIPENCNASINTNFTTVTEEKIEKLIKSNLKLINISLDAASDNTYKVIRNYNLQDTLCNIKKLISARDNYQKYTIKVIINMTLMRLNIEEVVDFIFLAKKLKVDGVYFGHLNRWDNDTMNKYRFSTGESMSSYKEQLLSNYKLLSNTMIKEALKKSKKLNIEILLDHNKNIFFNTEESTSKVNPEPEIRDCIYPWTWMLVSTDGNVSPCCFSSKPIGNIYNFDSAKDIWNNQEIKDLRYSILNNEIHPICSGAPCKFARNRTATKRNFVSRLKHAINSHLG